MTEVKFRCTYCQALIPWALDKKDVGLKPEESFQPGKLYPYEKCRCGWGKFVLCEGGGAVPEAAADATAAEGRVREKMERARYLKIPLAQIDPNPHQPRKFFDAEALASLADSIRKVGLLEDIVVRPVGKRYQIVLGERRWRASKLAGATTISAKVVDLDDEAVRLIALTENIHRENLTQVEEAFAYKRYVDEGKKLTEVGETLGRMGDRVAEKLKVLNTHHYIRYQEERIQKLQEMVESLRGQLDGAEPVYESKIVGVDEVQEYLNQGYDLMAAVDAGHIILRRRVR
ncbi:MAG TPA: ParB/RepB/Spo0J family partition protein [Candidatus Acidoferrales bacterium]|nr:ParB/RepB/Spo0J family partition protein [Candidatus Acidoferrales bacterium]